MHLENQDVKAGTEVKEGQVIGKTGQSGNAAGQRPEEDHLHFEISKDPLPGATLDSKNYRDHRDDPADYIDWIRWPIKPLKTKAHLRTYDVDESK